MLCPEDKVVIISCIFAYVEYRITSLWTKTEYPGKITLILGVKCTDDRIPIKIYNTLRVLGYKYTF